MAFHVYSILCIWTDRQILPKRIVKSSINYSYLIALSRSILFYIHIFIMMLGLSIINYYTTHSAHCVIRHVTAVICFSKYVFFVRVRTQSNISRCCFRYFQCVRYALDGSFVMLCLFGCLVKHVLLRSVPFTTYLSLKRGLTRENGERTSVPNRELLLTLRQIYIYFVFRTDTFCSLHDNLNDCQNCQNLISIL